MHATLLPGHHTAQIPLFVTANRDLLESCGAPVACRTSRLMPSPRECKSTISGTGDAADLMQELSGPATELTCPNPASGTVSEPAAPQWQERRINGLNRLQQARGIDHLGFPWPRMAKVAHRSLSLLPTTGLLHSPHHASRENKDAPMLCRQHPYPRHFLCPRDSQEISPALDKYEQPFPHLCHPRARR